MVRIGSPTKLEYMPSGTDTDIGIAIGMMFTISPLWIGETCRPELRGFFLCFFNTSIVFGQFAMSVWYFPAI